VFAPDPESDRPGAYLKQFSGALDVDRYGGFERLQARDDVILTAFGADYTELSIVRSGVVETQIFRTSSRRRTP